MKDTVVNLDSLESVWDHIVVAIRESAEDRDTEDYFLGIYEGLMWTLAELSVFMGRTKEYANLCEELDRIKWINHVS